MNNNIFIVALFCFSLIFSPSTMNLDNKVYSKVKEEICNIEEYGMKIEYITGALRPYPQTGRSGSLSREISDGQHTRVV